MQREKEMADIDDLKAAFEQAMDALNACNLDAFSAVLHDEVVYFGPGSPFPLEGKAARQQLFEMGYTRSESITVTSMKPPFRIIGTTGSVWMHVALMRRPKDGPVTNIADISCATCTFAKGDGKWLLVAEHYSPLPSGSYRLPG